MAWWYNAFAFPGQDISYLHSLQAQSFPHIPKNQLAQLADSTKMDKMDIYENPSEHYASINNYGIAGTVECSSHLEDGNRKLVWTVLTNFDFQASPDRACWTKREPRDQISTAMVSLTSGLLSSGRVNIVWHHLGGSLSLREEIKRPRWYGSVGSIHAEVMAVPHINLNIFFMIMASPSKEAMAAILWKFCLLPLCCGTFRVY